MSSNETIGGGGFHHVAIRANDFDRSVAFYKDVLGFTMKIEWGEAPKRACMLDTGDGNYLEIFERPSEQWADEGPCILHFALRSRDPDAAIERARAAGCEITMEPRSMQIGNHTTAQVRLAFCKGPDGELVEFLHSDEL